MDKNDYLLPESIRSLIDKKIWPLTEEESNKQFYDPIVKKENLQKILPSEDEVIFYYPPFLTAKERIELGGTIHSLNFSDGSDLDFERLLIIGDFGAGSDTYLGLYFESQTEHFVVKETWNESNNQITASGWVKISDSFNTFAEDLQIMK